VARITRKPFFFVEQSMSQIRRVFTGLAVVLLGAALSACSGGGTVATVNGQPITKAEFDAKLEESPIARQVLQSMVLDRLIEQYAQKHNIQITPQEIAQREDQIKANFPGNSWEQLLNSRGLTEKDVQHQLKIQLIIDKALASNVHVTPTQIKQYFDKNHAAFDQPAEAKARHILVSDLATAEKVEKLLKEGQHFSALAKEYSIDPGSKDNGGELGWFRQGQMVPAFDKYAFSAPIGAISPPIKSPFGYHIIQVQERKPAVKATLANSSQKIEQMLAQQQEQPLIAPFLQQLQQQATIQINDPRFAGLFPTPPPATSAASPSSPAPAATK